MSQLSFDFPAAVLPMPTGPNRTRSRSDRGTGRPGRAARTAAAALDTSRALEPDARQPSVTIPVSQDAEPDESPVVHEDGLWQEQGWTVRIVRGEDGDGWLAEMTLDGEQDPTLTTPWPADEERQQARALHASAFNTLIKNAREFRERNQRQLRAMLHRRLNLHALEREWVLTLDIVPDEYEPHAILAAIDDHGVTVARLRVEAEFRLTHAAGLAWVQADFRQPVQQDP